MFGNDELNTEGTRSAKRSLDYLNRAQCAQQEGDDSLATSLYLAAFDCAQKEGVASENIFIDGLKQAWFLAASSKQRTLAEHIFSLMEPYLSQDEVQQYVLRLQDLALERLEEFGVDRGELEQVLSSIPSQLADMGFSGMDALFDEFLDEIENEIELTDDICTEEDCSECPDSDVCEYHQANPALNDSSDGESVRNDGDSSEAPDAADAANASEVLKGDDDSAAASGKSGTASDRFVIRNAGGAGANNRSEHHAAIVGKQEDGQNAADASQAPDVLPFLSQILQGGHGAIAAFGLPGVGQKSIQAANRLTYADMAGFEHAIEQMHALGIGFANNPELKNFISFLNEKHGLSGMPVSDAIVFRSAAREDASRFMEATLGELELPGVRINVDENIHGDLVLCVMAQTSLGLRFNASKGQIDGSGVLLLEDIDLWGHLLPFDDDCFECASSRSGAQGPSKGALEAVRLIRSAVENPDVYVLASCSNDADIQGAFLDILEPLTVVDIDYPTASERTSLWNDLMNKHPSMKGAQIETLVACSKGLPRFDICMAAREAIEASYKESLSTRKYEPLTTAAICEKLAAYQPLDSDEYKSLEEQVVSDFRRELEGLDAFLGFEGANDVATLLGEDRDGLGSAESDAE